MLQDTEIKTLLLGLPTAKSSSELHGSRSRTCSSGLVVTSLPVGFSVSLLADTTGPWGGTGTGTLLPGGLALEGGGHDLRGEVEIVAEVLDTLVGQAPVEVPPGELLLHIATGLQRSQGLDDLNKKCKSDEILNIKLT